MKIERKYLAHYINVGSRDAAVFERLGEDLEEFTPEMAANVEKTQNILGQSRVIISGYDKTATVATYYAHPGTHLFKKLQEIIDNNSVLEDLRVEVVDVHLWESPQEAVFPAALEEAYLEITSYGGDYKGYSIGFTLHYTGNKVLGLFDVKTATFTEGLE